MTEQFRLYVSLCVRERARERKRSKARANFIATRLERTCGGILPLDFWFE